MITCLSEELIRIVVLGKIKESLLWKKKQPEFQFFVVQIRQ